MEFEELSVLADFLWNEAQAAPALLDDQSSRVALLCVLDAGGSRTLSIEATAAPTRSTERDRGAEPVSNVRKQLERRVAALDAKAAGLAGRIDVVTFHGRFEWLTVLAANHEHDIGRIASITRDDGGTATVASPNDWRRERPDPFGEDPWPFLSQTRNATQGLLRQGLRQAAKHRRRHR